jgi:hypothetical protein
LNSILAALRTAYPEAARLLEATVHSTNFCNCPSPGDWIRFFATAVHPMAQPPGLADLQSVDAQHMASLLARHRPWRLCGRRPISTRCRRGSYAYRKPLRRDYHRSACPLILGASGIDVRCLIVESEEEE